MRDLTIRNITQICGGRFAGHADLMDKEVSAITTDSRNITCGCLFVAIKGERVDGCDFAEQAVRDGAIAVLAGRALAEDIPQIIVGDPLAAVREIAAAYRQSLGIRVVGITGSVGKTSTKEMIAHVLEEQYSVLKTAGNFNNALGLPLTIFRLREEHQIAVLEMGISDFGEMRTLTQIARPDICVMTNIGDCHLESLGDRDGVLRAKSEIFEGLSADGAIVLNGDDEKLNAVDRPERTLRFGLGAHNAIRADAILPRGLEGIDCRIHTPEGDFDVRIPSPGQHMVYNALAGTAVGLLCGMDLAAIKRGIERFETISGRFRLVHAGGRTIIDDCYNANPASMRASLDVLAQADGRRVAILGDMGELGAEEEQLHRDLGAYAARCGIDVLCCAGTLAAGIAEGARDQCAQGPEIRSFATRDALINALPEILGPSDTVLVKASHFMQFDRVVEALCVGAD